MSIIRKYHNHKLQTDPRHCEEELQDIYSNNSDNVFFSVDELREDPNNTKSGPSHLKVKQFSMFRSNTISVLVQRAACKTRNNALDGMGLSKDTQYQNW